ncbi:hypothetical protein [Paraclostridium sordellii]|uniref:hypothetical protein n=1 Tax=Paraclostridium sordellii TaxID=1505 RepID=UPI0005DD2E08|nr:hypothetical protein [Paeniclostridium sordellii]CEN21186.1 Uncharacterised protein [[Clostridium] sordellii] [Paeniclostridium sordellii]
MSIEIDGLDEFMDSLDQMQQSAEQLANKQSISLDELFTYSFMKDNTNFTSIDELLKSGNFIVNSQEDFESLPEDELDVHIANTTKFSTWNEMFSSASDLYLDENLGF